MDYFEDKGVMKADIGRFSIPLGLVLVGIKYVFELGNEYFTRSLRWIKRKVSTFKLVGD